MISKVHVPTILRSILHGFTLTTVEGVNEQTCLIQQQIKAGFGFPASHTFCSVSQLNNSWIFRIIFLSVFFLNDQLVSGILKKCPGREYDCYEMPLLSDKDLKIISQIVQIYFTVCMIEIVLDL